MRLPDWPLFDLRLRCGGVGLRPVREDDLALLGELQPDDYELDPRFPAYNGHSGEQHRRRLVYQSYWRSMGTWSPEAWSLELLVEYAGEVVGLQGIEGDDYPTLRTVDSHSWLVPRARRQGIGVAMRQAALALAFDRLGAVAAVTSARRDNAASLGVSRHLGYRDNGVSLNHAADGVIELQHLRLTAAEWRTSGLGGEVEVDGVEPCLPWFGLGRA
ncbi:GNAT family protein [Nocardioides sp. KR10-350]|uniref:GNAT family N-acetyltransferase n=1 Tax=Nocardioides cheoyonin TaxID=3156615 RepID=UPI0032B615F6